MFDQNYKVINTGICWKIYAIYDIISVMLWQHFQQSSNYERKNVNYYLEEFWQFAKKFMYRSALHCWINEYYMNTETICKWSRYLLQIYHSKVLGLNLHVWIDWTYGHMFLFTTEFTINFTTNCAIGWIWKRGYSIG